MFKRICAVILSLSLFITPSFAWSWESFVGKDNLPGAADPVYDLEPVLFSSRPMMMSAGDGVSLAVESVDSKSYSLDDLVLLMTPPESAAAIVEVYHPGTTVAGITVPSWTEFRSYPESGGSPLSLIGTTSAYSYYHFVTPLFTVPDTLNGGEVVAFRGVAVPPYSASSPNRSYSFDIDISGFGSFRSFGLSGLLEAFADYYRGGYINDLQSCSLGIYVNGSLVRTFYPQDDGIFNFGSFVYDSYVDITSLSFVLNPLQEYSFSPYFSEQRVAFSFRKSSSFALTVLSGALGKPSGMDSADSALNDYQQQEGEYFEGANDAINDLDTSLSSNISGAAQMLGGLFNDLWSVMGDVKLLYFTPLLFGFFLWLIGRVRR